MPSFVSPAAIAKRFGSSKTTATLPNLGALWLEAERFGRPRLYLSELAPGDRYSARIDLATDNAHVEASVLAWARSPERALELAIAKARGEDVEDE